MFFTLQKVRKVHKNVSYYGASEASVVFRRLTEISEYERPAGRGHAFQRLISH